MKPLAITTFLLAFIILTSLKQDKEIQKPKAIYQVGFAKVIVFEIKKADGTIYKEFKIEKEYIKDGKSETTNSFDDVELLDVKAAIDKAIKGENIKTNIGDGNVFEFDK